MSKVSVGWGVTSACNMKCEFCYSRQARVNEERRSLEEMIEFVDLNANDISAVNYGTGENTLCDDWYKLIKYIRDNYPSIEQSLTTNGTLYQVVSENEEYKKIFIDAIDEVDVSLDFWKEEKHNKFRGRDTTYYNAIKTLELCQKYGKRATIVFIGSNETLQIDNLEGIFEIAKKYDCKLRMNVFRPVDKSNEDYKKFICSYDNLLNALYWINDNHKILLIQDALLNAMLVEEKKKADESKIYFNSVRIIPNGAITPSTYLITKDYQIANIKDKVLLSDICKDKIYTEINKVPECKDCEGCELYQSCQGGVVDRRLLWYSTLDRRDPYCPLENGKEFPKKKIQIYDDENFTSVHADYLPTIFFAY